SNTNSASSIYSVSPLGIGSHTLVGLEPTDPSAVGSLLIASALNDQPAEQLEIFEIFPGPLTFSFGPWGDTGLFERGNALQLTTNNPTFAAGIIRGEPNDVLHIWQFTNPPGVAISLSNLPPGSDYVFGKFNN